MSDSLPCIHPVKKGETLVGIAITYGLSVDWIKFTNPTINFRAGIFAGDMLALGAEPVDGEVIESVSVLRLDVIGQKVIKEGRLLVVGKSLRFESPPDKAFVLGLADVVEMGAIPLPRDVCDEVHNGLFFVTTPGSSVYDRSMHCFAGEKALLFPFHEKVAARKLTIPPKRDPVLVQRRHNVTVIGEYGIMEKRETEEVRNALPKRLWNRNWRLAFRMSQDGCSYLSFFEKIGAAVPMVMVISGVGGQRIGAFVTHGFVKAKRFYGSAETFVFRFGTKLEIFRGAARNNYYTACANEEVMIGGGETSAIWIGKNFVTARSQQCLTFNSPALIEGETFKIVDLEVWRIETPKLVM